MILEELAKYYNRLLENPATEVSEPGFSKENISFKIIIDKDGHIVDSSHPITDLRDRKGKNLVPKKITVPKFDGKQTSGIRSYFLWGKSHYIIGLVLNEKNKNKPFEEEKPKHKKAFIDLIDMVISRTGRNHPVFLAVKNFALSDDVIPILKQSECWKDFLNTFVVFEVEGYGNTVFEQDEVNDIWREYYSLFTLENAEKGLCLVTGEEAVLSRILPTIKKGVGGKNDVPLVSCNINIGESYNKKGNAISPISKSAAFAFTESLNYLLTTDKHNITIADTKIVFWTEKETDAAAIFWEISNGGEDDGYSSEVETYLRSVKEGIVPDELKDTGKIFVLGLAPNAARVSIRFWYVDTIERLSMHIGEHYKDLEIVKEHRDKDKSFPSIWQLLIETAPQHAKKDRDEITKSIPPNIIGPLMRSVLEGFKYPASLLSVLINRMRVDQGFNRMNYYRAAFIKAILNRNYKKELVMSLDRDRKSLPYCIGRLFAVLEKVQEESAAGKINATIKDRYFSSASARPRVVFPRLINLSQNHFKKLRSEKPGLAVVREKELTDIIGVIPSTGFPATLKLEDQGEFAIGYYHQRQSFFEKKDVKEND